MHKKHLPSTTRTRKEGIFGQLYKKPFKTKPKFRTFGHSLEYEFRNTFNSLQTSEINFEKCEKYNKETESDIEGISRDAWENKFHHNSGSAEQMLGQKLVCTPEKITKKSENISPSFLIAKPKKVGKKSKVDKKTPDKHSSPNDGYIHGCITSRLGIPFNSGSPGTRKLAICVQKPTHKFKRINNSLDSNKADSSSKEYTHTCEFRQLNDGFCHKAARFNKISTNKFMGPLNFKSSSKTKNYSINCPHKWSIKRASRCTIQNKNISNRVETGSENILNSAQIASGSRNRYVCDSSQQATANVYFSIPGPSGSSIKCSSSGLERMVTHIPFSSNQKKFNSGSSEKTESISRCSFTNSSQLAKCDLVSDVAESMCASISGESHFDTEDTQQDPHMSFILSEGSTGMDLLRKYFCDKFGEEIAEAIVQDSRPSTLRQYNSVFKIFTAFLKDSREKSISESTFLKFFLYCKNKLGRQATTIYSYRSALKRIAMQVFKIDLYSQHFESLLKGIKLKQKILRIPNISWCLDKVLSYLENIDNSDIKLFTGKAAFLLQLAMGCRISELASVSRDVSYTQFLPGGQLKIMVDPKLMEKHSGYGLKKHERMEKRDAAIIINSLFLGNSTTPSQLCPVTTIRNYMTLTTHYELQEQQLFVNYNTQKPMNISQLRSTTVSIIQKACPMSSPKTHDIRKVSATVSLMSSMSLDEISSKTGWSQAKTFWSHYNVPIRKLSQECIALGVSTV